MTALAFAIGSVWALLFFTEIMRIVKALERIAKSLERAGSKHTKEGE